MTKFDNHLKEHVQYTKEVEDINLGLIVSDGQRFTKTETYWRITSIITLHLDLSKGYDYLESAATIAPEIFFFFHDDNLIGLWNLLIRPQCLRARQKPSSVLYILQSTTYSDQLPSLTLTNLN